MSGWEARHTFGVEPTSAEQNAAFNAAVAEQIERMEDPGPLWSEYPPTSELDLSLSLEQIVGRLNDGDDEAEPVKVDSVRKALNRGIPERFRLSAGKYGIAR